jgi:hypothetical protein
MLALLQALLLLLVLTQPPHQLLLLLVVQLLHCQLPPLLLSLLPCMLLLRCLTALGIPPARQTHNSRGGSVSSYQLVTRLAALVDHLMSTGTACQAALHY